MEQSLAEQILRAWERGYEEGINKGYKRGLKDRGDAKPDAILRVRPLTGCTTIRGIGWCGKPTVIGDSQRICNDCRRSFGIKVLEGPEQARESLTCEAIDDYFTKDDGI